MRFLWAIAVLLAAPALAHDYKAGDLTIDHPMAFETAKTARAGGGFLTITNAGDSDDRLLEVRTDFPMTQIHQTSVDDKGVASMSEVGTVAIPAGETVTLQPGGLHIMFMGLTPETALVLGEVFEAVLVFERAGEVAVEFQIEKRTHKGHEGH